MRRGTPKSTGGDTSQLDELNRHRQAIHALLNHLAQRDNELKALRDVNERYVSNVFSCHSFIFTPSLPYVTENMCSLSHTHTHTHTHTHMHFHSIIHSLTHPLTHSLTHFLVFSFTIINSSAVVALQPCSRRGAEQAAVGESPQGRYSHAPSVT